MSLQKAIEAGQARGKTALYFGCWGGPGHYLVDSGGQNTEGDVPNFPWDMSLLDGGLLKNGKRPDVYDGKVYWTCGGLDFWYAFYWWDRSVDKRGASNSGFYVRWFGWPEAPAAFAYACASFPRVVSRQLFPIVLQEPRS